MDGIIWLLLSILLLAFVAGYRYGTGRHLFGSVWKRGFNTTVNRNEFRALLRRGINATPIDLVCHKAVSLEHAKPSAHEEVIYYFLLEEVPRNL